MSASPFLRIALTLILGLALVGGTVPLRADEAELLQKLDELYLKFYSFHEEAQTEADQIFLSLRPEEEPRAFLKAYGLASSTARAKREDWPYPKVLALAEQQQDPAIPAELLYYHGMEVRDAQLMGPTVEIFKKARELAKRSADRLLEGLIVSELANTYCLFNARREAAESMEESLNLIRDDFSHLYALNVRSAIGTILSINYKKNESIRFSIPLFQELKARKLYYAASIEATNLGIRNRDKNEPDIAKAMSYFDEAIELAQLARDKDGKATALNALGALYLKSNPKKAIALLEEARKLFRELHDAFLETESSLVLVDAYINDHQARKAREILAQLPGREGAVGKHYWYIVSLKSRIAAEERDFETAFRLYVQYHESWEQTKNEEEQAELARFSTQLNLKVEEEKSRSLELDLQKSARERQLLLSILVLGTVIGVAMLWGLLQGRIVKRQKKLLQDIMDTVQEGIFRLGPDRLLRPPYARQLEQILGQKDLAHTRILDHLLADQVETRAIVEACLDAVFGESQDAWEFNASNFPEEITCKGRSLELLWHPICDKHGVIQQIMLIVRDNTEQKQFQMSVAQERARTDQRNRCAIELKQTDIIRAERFLDRLLQGMAKKDDDSTFRHQLHTWKGEARTLGLAILAAQLHEWEQNSQRSADWLQPLVETYRTTLRDMLIIPAIKRQGGVLDLCASLLEETKQRLQAANIAWGEQTIRQNFESTDPEVLDGLRTILLHGLSNAADHGFLRAAPRTESASFALSIELVDGMLHVRLEDNGQGIDWQKVQQLALRRGLSTQKKEDVVQVLFMDGVSTADQVSLTSGRGLGLAAIQSLSRSWGGHVQLRDAEGHSGTCLDVRIPWPFRTAA